MNFEKFESTLSNVLMPIAQKVNGNKMMSAVAEGFMRTTPITLGVAIFAIIGNLPITAWTDWLNAMNLKVHFDAALGASTNIIAVYVAFSIAYAYAKKHDFNGISAGFISLASFMIMVPQTIVYEGGETAGISIQYLGSNGLVVGLITAILTSLLFVKLSKKNIVFKMPSSVPPMVSESLGPVFIAIIIFSAAFFVRVGFSFTSYATSFNFIQTIVTQPLLAIGLSVPAIILFYTLANLLWFFGIHPTTIYGPINPLLVTMVLANIDALQKGEPFPYLVTAIVVGAVYIGSTGNTLGLLACMARAKSQRYKAMFKLSIVPNLFNINEPVIFGTPIMLNPIFFIPMVFSSAVMGLVAWALASIIPLNYNPLMALLPWTTPFFINGFLSGGFPILFILLAAFAVNIVMYYPFFRIADKKAVEEERIAASEAANQ